MLISVPNPTHLRADGVSFAFPDRRVLTDVSLVVSSGQVVGLIGENGSGKSTLLGLIAGDLEPDAGQISVVGGGEVTIGLLRQDSPFEVGVTVGDAIEVAVSEARVAAEAVDNAAAALAENPDDEAVMDEYSSALEAANLVDAWTVDARIARTVAELGLANVEASRRVRSLSGGQRARLALACLLLNAPGVLLLDEPTNHLDERGVAFLTQVLSGWKGPVLLASHDRAFLDEAVTDLFDLDLAPTPLRVMEKDNPPASGTRFHGNYSDYLLHRRAARERWEQQFEEEQAALKRLRAGLRVSHQVGHTSWKPKSESRIAQKFYGDRNARVVARRVNDARSRLDALEKKQIRKPPPELIFGGLSDDSRKPQDLHRGTAVAAHEAAVEGRLAPVSFTLAHGEKLLVTGPNGCGKSTLLQLLGAGGDGIRCTRGDAWVAGGLTVGMLSQESSLHQGRGSANLGQITVAQLFEASVIGGGSQRLTDLGLLSPVELHRPVASLSLGQQRRLELAVLIADPPDVLILDEPTNHLSLSLVTAIEESIQNYPGTVLVASHDKWMREHWPGRHLQLRAN